MRGLIVMLCLVAACFSGSKRKTKSRSILATDGIELRIVNHTQKTINEIRVRSTGAFFGPEAVAVQLAPGQQQTVRINRASADSEVSIDLYEANTNFAVHDLLVAAPTELVFWEGAAPQLAPPSDGFAQVVVEAVKPHYAPGPYVAPQPDQGGEAPQPSAPCRGVDEVVDVSRERCCAEGGSRPNPNGPGNLCNPP